jgi:hypothetical protein
MKQAFIILTFLVISSSFAFQIDCENVSKNDAALAVDKYIVHSFRPMANGKGYELVKISQSSTIKEKAKEEIIFQDIDCLQSSTNTTVVTCLVHSSGTTSAVAGLTRVEYLSVGLNGKDQLRNELQLWWRTGKGGNPFTPPKTEKITFMDAKLCQTK